MAVVPMQKVQLLVHESDVDAALSVVQQSGALEFQVVERSREIPAGVQFPHDQLLPRVMHAVQFLEPYEAKKGLWRTLREGTTTDLTETEVKARLEDTDGLASVVADVEDLQVEFADKSEQARKLEEQKQWLETWQALPFALNQLETPNTVTILVTCSTASDRSLEAQVAEVLSEVSYALTVIAHHQVALTVEKTERNRVEELLETADLEVVPAISGENTPEVEMTAVGEALAKVNGELAVLHDQAEHAAQTHLGSLRVAGEVLSWQRDRYAVIDAAGATSSTLIFEGWIDATQLEAVEAAFTKDSVAAVVATIEPAEGEEPPVEIRNHALVQPFESVTRLYGMPGHTDLDPTVFLAGFFFLFFGLSLTDVGYGLTLMIVSAMILTLFKVSDTIRTFAKLLLFVGFSTVLVGLLFGGYLGLDPALLPAPLQALQLFDPIGNPLPVFYLALSLGVIQVMAGMVIKIYSEAKQGRLMSGFLDQAPWLFTFMVGILYVGTVTGYVDFFSTAQLTNLAYVGLVMIVLSSGRHGKGILGKVQAAATSLYDSIGYFSDILSYSRLLALGLATTALAYAVNLIAGIVAGSMPFVGPIFAALILVIGHVFTLAVNTLGAFIHSARLQFVEFFGKFIAGTGREFSPLTRKKKYVSIRDD